MMNRAPFKHKQGRSRGLQGRKLQGRQIDGEGGGSEGAILQLCSLAPKLMIHWDPQSAASWIRPWNNREQTTINVLLDKRH